MRTDHERRGGTSEYLIPNATSLASLNPDSLGAIVQHAIERPQRTVLHLLEYERLTGTTDDKTTCGRAVPARAVACGCTRVTSRAPFCARH